MSFGESDSNSLRFTCVKHTHTQTVLRNSESKITL